MLTAMRMPTSSRVLAPIVVLALVLTACGDEPELMPSPAPAPAAHVDADDAAGAGAVDADERAAYPDTAATAPDGPAAPRVAPDRGLYTVQIAAFTDRELATLWTGRLLGQGLPVWNSVVEHGGRTFYRVRVGAAPALSEARRLGQLLTERYDWPVWVAPVSPAEPVPANAVADTRRVIDAS
jgi:cell division septation protein DedD